MTRAQVAYAALTSLAERDLTLITCARIKCGQRFYYVAARGVRATLCLDCADELLGRGTL
jgi:hypothetical protein